MDLTVTVERIDAAHGPEARTLIAHAFAEDPLITWLFPPTEGDDERRLDAIATFYLPSVEAYSSSRSGHVALAGTRLVGVSLWGLPGTTTEQHILPRASSVAALVLGDTLELLTAGMTTARGNTTVPSTPYLHDLAVDPTVQNQGVGSRLLDAGIREFAAGGAWLETTNPRNHGLYERAGFRAEHVGNVGESGVTTTRMVLNDRGDRPPDDATANS